MADFNVKGEHHILDIWQADFKLLDDMQYLKSILTKALELSGASILSIQEKKFEPQGCTLLFLLSESHCSIHTSPEFQYGAIDIFTCGGIQPQKSIDFLMEALGNCEYHYEVIQRGDATGFKHIKPKITKCV